MTITAGRVKNVDTISPRVPGFWELLSSKHKSKTYFITGDQQIKCATTGSNFDNSHRQIIAESGSRLSKLTTSQWRRSSNCSLGYRIWTNAFIPCGCVVKKAICLHLTGMPCAFLVQSLSRGRQLTSTGHKSNKLHCCKEELVETK